MRTTFFFFAMLISIAVSATVKVTPLSTDYSENKVTFKVEWTGTPYNNHVWVWVDLRPIAGTSPGTFEKAVISAASVTSGTYTDLNGRGFFITANGTTVTATLSNASGKFNWCAYGSDYPPNVTANGGIYTLHGTPPFTLIAASGTPTQKVSGTTITTSAVTITPTTITDETGYPGEFCHYQGSDLYIDATHLCQQRTSGAQNWEAYIKDNRDDQIYRITQFSDGSWWMADDLAIADKSVGTCNGKRYYKGNDKPTCPSGWQLPTDEKLLTRFPNPTTTDAHGATITVGCYYGISAMCGYSGCTSCGTRYDMVCSNANNTPVWVENDRWHWNCDGNGSDGATVTGIAARARCIRNL
ncbi:MAG: hypothetical protein LBU42_08325 [Prevotellaceae bacterium]|jgi:uncharacterized protein (TIGR02145 family)|nr:hypothetical protein [Prevotellaceae bacterium]